MVKAYDVYDVMMRSQERERLNKKKEVSVRSERALEQEVLSYKSVVRF